MFDILDIIWYNKCSYRGAGAKSRNPISAIVGF